MRDAITDDEQRFYGENGYVVVDGFLDDAELQTWRGATDEAVRAREGKRFSFRSDDTTDDLSGEAKAYLDYYDEVFTQRINLWQTSPAMRRLLFDPDLGRVAAVMAGVDGVRIWQDQALIKEPFANPTSFHLDVPYWSFHALDAITIWIALDDATLDNGCLYYVAGSHRTQRLDDVAIGRSIGAVFDFYPEWRDVPAVACPVSAGSALFHNGLTIHGAGANMTPGRRRAMTCAYMPDGSRFNGLPNILPPAYLHTLRVGDTLDNEEQNPLIWSRGREGDLIDGPTKKG